jgi:hypothetical protein
MDFEKDRRRRNRKISQTLPENNDHFLQGVYITAKKSKSYLLLTFVSVIQVLVDMFKNKKHYLKFDEKITTLTFVSSSLRCHFTCLCLSNLLGTLLYFTRYNLSEPISPNIICLTLDNTETYGNVLVPLADEITFTNVDKCILNFDRLC